MSQIRVLVVEDSPFMRRELTSIIESDPELVVVGIARNGEQAIALVRELAPDVVTLDIALPRMDGLTALIHIMMEHATPTVVVSALTQDDASTTLEALELGAVDYVAKPSGTVSLDIDRQRDEIVAKIRAAARARVGHRSRAGRRSPASESGRAAFLHRPDLQSATPGTPATPPHAIVAIGVSTGGPRTLLEVLPVLPASLSVPVVLVQHMPATFIRAFARRLDGASAVSVKEARHNETLRAGTVYVAPGGYQMTVADTADATGPKIHLGHRPRGRTFCPSVNVLFHSVAQVYGETAVGVLLTGMGDDGAQGMVAIRRAGGTTIAESEESAVVFGMSRVAIELGGADVVVPADLVAEQILRALREQSR